MDEFGVGTFTDPNGNSIYGIDPELATRLAQIKDVTANAPDQRTAGLAGGLELLPGAMRSAGQAMTQPLPWVQKANEEKMRSDAVPQMSMPEQPATNTDGEGMMSMPEDNEDKLQSAEPPPLERTEEPQPDMADDELMPIAGLDKTSPEFRQKLVEMAKAKGLDPNAIAAVIATESGFKAQAMNPNQANAGLLQFSKKYWPGFAANAGTPDVTWEQMRKMTAEEQLPYVISYFEHANLPPNATPRDYKLATFYPDAMGKDDDHVLFEKDNDAKVPGGFRSSVGYSQNAGLDKNKDGQITVGEVSGTLNRVASRAGRSLGTSSAAPRQATTEMVSTGEEDSAQGPLISPYDQQVLDVANEQNRAIGAVEQQAQAEAARRVEYFKKQQEALAQQRAEKEGRLRSEQQAMKLADDKLRAAFDEPVQKLDPDQYYKRMSTGDRIMSVISVVAGAIGQAFLNAAGIKAGNSGLELLNRELENSIMRQKEEILAGRADRNNRIEHYRQQGFNAQAALKLASAELDTVTSNQLKSEAAKLDGDQETQRWMLQESTRLRDRGQQMTDQVRKEEHANQLLRLEAARTASQLESAAIDNQLKLQKLQPQESVIYRPGDEDTSDQARQRIAREFDSKDDAKSYAEFGFGMAKAKQLDDVTGRLQKLVGLERGTDGKFLPAKDGIPGVGIFDFKRELGDERAREIEKTLTEYRSAFRATFKTEPPPAVEATISDMLRAKFEGDMPGLLERMLAHAKNTADEATAQTLPRVRARWKSDNGFPLRSNTSAPGIRRK